MIIAVMLKGDRNEYNQDLCKNSLQLLLLGALGVLGGSFYHDFALIPNYINARAIFEERSQ